MLHHGLTLWEPLSTPHVNTHQYHFSEPGDRWCSHECQQAHKSASTSHNPSFFVIRKHLSVLRCCLFCYPSFPLCGIIDRVKEDIHWQSWWLASNSAEVSRSWKNPYLACIFTPSTSIYSAISRASGAQVWGAAQGVRDTCKLYLLHVISVKEKTHINLEAFWDYVCPHRHGCFASLPNWPTEGTG